MVNIMKKRSVLLILLGAVFLCTTSPAYAILFGFDVIVKNDTDFAEAATGEAQFFVDVTDPSEGEDLSATSVLFTFRNMGTNASIIAGVYFDDNDSLLSNLSLIDSDDGSGGDSGVDFSSPATPADLPGGNEVIPPFVTTEQLSASADPPVGTNGNGVDPDEFLGVLFDLTDPFTLEDVLNDLYSGDLRVGIHGQGLFPTGGSESFINNPDPIPEPATMLLLGTGLIGLAGIGRRKFFSKKK
jgi:hypothetical protein